MRPGREPWREDTLVETRSATKGVTALCLHMLVDRGAVDLDVLVRHYWPSHSTGQRLDHR